MGSKVVVGLSGGVDSSVAALLLKRQGYEVIGATMSLFPQGDPIGNSALEDARRVADRLGIEHVILDFHEAFQREVIDYFVNEYANGRTPNPCVICNRRVKWEALLSWGFSQGADFVATGHYARVTRLSNGRYALRNSATATKDQTYALYNLTQNHLARTLFPVGEYEKSEIRHMAEVEKIPVANKPDSQDICFLANGNYGAFLEEKLPKDHLKPGNFVSLDGKVLGRHRGIIHYTVGQRRGLGLTQSFPSFVVEIRANSNEVVIGNQDDLLRSALVCDHINDMGMGGLHSPRRCRAKIRYGHRGEECVIEPVEGAFQEAGDEAQISVTFDRPVRAITPGQAVVFYDGEDVLGGGLIVRSM